jgi:hypothetical protein
LKLTNTIKLPVRNAASRGATFKSCFLPRAEIRAIMHKPPPILSEHDDLGARFLSSGNRACTSISSRRSKGQDERQGKEATTATNIKRGIHSRPPFHQRSIRTFAASRGSSLLHLKRAGFGVSFSTERPAKPLLPYFLWDIGSARARVSHQRHSSGSSREGGMDIAESTSAPAFPMSRQLNPSARRNALAILATNLEGGARPR